MSTPILEIRNLTEKVSALSRCAKTKNMLNHRAVIPRPVKENNFAFGWQMLDIPLEVPLTGLAIRWFWKRHNARDTGIQVHSEPCNGSTFSGRIPSFKNHNQSFACAFGIGLEAHELQLKRIEISFVLRFAQRASVWVGLGKDVFFFRVLYRSAHISGRATLKEFTDCAVEGKCHVIRLYFPQT